MTVHIVIFRYGSRSFARAFSIKENANGYALRVRTTLGVLADVVSTTLDAFDIDLKHINGETPP